MKVDQYQDNVRKVFVYGTLKRGFYRGNILQDSRLYGKDNIRGYLLTGGWGYPALALEENAPLVHGEVYDCSPHMRARLDAIEGVPDLYNRIAVRTFKGHVAWVYIMPITKVRPAEFKILPNGEWSGQEGKETLIHFMNCNLDYTFPRLPRCTYDASMGVMVVEQKFEPHRKKEIVVVGNAHSSGPPPTPKTPEPPKPEPLPYSDTDAPMPGVCVGWADNTPKDTDELAQAEVVLDPPKFKGEDEPRGF